MQILQIFALSSLFLPPCFSRSTLQKMSSLSLQSLNLDVYRNRFLICLIHCINHIMVLIFLMVAHPTQQLMGLKTYHDHYHDLFDHRRTRHHHPRSLLASIPSLLFKFSYSKWFQSVFSSVFLPKFALSVGIKMLWSIFRWFSGVVSRLSLVSVRKTWC